MDRRSLAGSPPGLLTKKRSRPAASQSATNKAWYLRTHGLCGSWRKGDGRPKSTSRVSNQIVSGPNRGVPPRQITQLAMSSAEGIASPPHQAPSMPRRATATR
jgi:hypothetical protein